MANLSVVIKQLRNERERTARELERLDNAIAALNHMGTRGTGKRVSRSRRAGRKFSAAARARMAAAQRARWAKLKGKKPKAA